MATTRKPRQTGIRRRVSQVGMWTLAILFFAPGLVLATIVDFLTGAFKSLTREAALQLVDAKRTWRDIVETCRNV